MLKRSLPTGAVSSSHADRARPSDADGHSDTRSRPSAEPSARVHDDESSTTRRHSPAPPAPSRPTRDDVDEMSTRIDELEDEIAYLERELDRRDADHEEIIHRYEHVLAESSSAKSEETAPGSLRAQLTEAVDRTRRRFTFSRPNAESDARRQADDRPLRERLTQLLPWR